MGVSKNYSPDILVLPMSKHIPTSDSQLLEKMFKAEQAPRSGSK